MVLYHISTRRDELVKHFIPRVPESCAEDIGENSTVPRICLSDSPEHCLQAVGYDREMLTSITVYKGEFDLQDPDLYTPGYVQKYVQDALANREYWYCKEVTLSGEQFWVEHVQHDYLINWAVISKQQVYNEVSKVMSAHNKQGWLHSVYEMVMSSINSEQAYQNVLTAFNMDCDEELHYDLCDDVWDGLLELDWAKLLTVKNLRLKPL